MTAQANLGLLFYRRYDKPGAKEALTQPVSVPEWPSPRPETLEPLRLQTTYPGLLTGSGYTHPTRNEDEHKLGFYFDHTTGLPVIPGSSVKGVLRSAFPNQDNNFTPERYQFIAWLLDKHLSKAITAPEEKALVDALRDAIFEGIATRNDTPEPQYLSLYKKDIFFDATLEKGTYNPLLGDDYITPHYPDLLKEPIPIKFLKVMPDVVWEFRFRLQPFMWRDQVFMTATDKRQLFGAILLTLGVGAKTNVGYGHFVKIAAPPTKSGTALATTASRPLPLIRREFYYAGAFNVSKPYYVYIQEKPEHSDKVFFTLLLEGQPEYLSRAWTPAGSYEPGSLWEVRILTTNKKQLPTADIRPVRKIEAKKWKV